MSGVGQRRSVDQFHFGQQLASGGDFIALRRHGHSAQPPTGAINSADQFHVRVAQGFAIDNDQLVLRRSQHLFLPQQQGSLQRGSVNARQQSLEGAFARATNTPGAPLGPKSQRPQLPLRKAGGVFRQVLRPAAHPAEHGQGYQGQESG